MKCKKVKKMLSPYFDGELDEQKSQKVYNHLEICKNCYNEFNEIKKLDEIFKNCESIEPGPYFETKLFARIEGIKKSQLKFWAWERWWEIIFRQSQLVPTFAMIFLVLFISFYSGSFVYAVSTKSSEVKNKVVSLAIEKFAVSPSIINIMSIINFCKGCDKTLCECIRKKNPSANCVCGECMHNNEKEEIEQ